jgi:HK97 family phage major capsid protein
MLEQLRARLTELHESRAAAITAMEAATAPAETETRNLTDDETVAFDEARATVISIDEQTSTLESEIADLEQIAERSARIAERAPFQINNGVTREDPYGEVRRDASPAEMRGRVESILESERSLDGDASERVLDLVETHDRGMNSDNKVARHIIATGRPAYRSAFGKLVTGRPETLTPEESHAINEVRAATLTGSAGGAAVPYVIDTTMIDTNAGSVNPMRQLATVKTITTGTWTGVSSAGVTASWDAEAAEVSDDAPTLVAPTIDAEKGQMFVGGSSEVFDDWAGMEQDIRGMFSVARDNLESDGFTTGTGSGQPTGIIKALDGTASEVAPGTAETFAVGDVYALETALAARHRAGASFMANKAVYQLVRQFDANGGADMWERIGAGQPAQLLGYNAYENSSMDGAFDAAATADNFLLLLGDFKKFYIVDRLGMTVEYIPNLFGANNRPTGERGLLAHFRTGSGCVDINAFRLLNVATAA